MSDRRTIGAYLSRFNLEPSSKDIIVEGVFDQAVIKRLLRKLGITSVAVHRVQSIVVPSELLHYNERGSDRGRILALGREFERKAGTHAPVRCVRDRDLDDVLEVDVQESAGLALVTDVSSMEMYFYGKPILEEFFSDFLMVDGLDVEMLFASLDQVLCDLAFARAANESLELGCENLDFTSCCVYSSQSGVSFDQEEYITRYLNASDAMPHRDRFFAEVARLKDEISIDTSRWVSGRFYVALLEFVLKKLGFPRYETSQRAVQHGLMVTVTHHQLLEHPLFRTLSEWAEPSD